MSVPVLRPTADTFVARSWDDKARRELAALDSAGLEPAQDDRAGDHVH